MFSGGSFIVLFRASSDELIGFTRETHKYLHMV